MAGADRSQDQHLSFLAQARAEVELYGLFPLVRGAEARAPSLPRVGEAKRPELNIVDLAQEPHLNFAAATLSRIDTSEAGRSKVRGQWLGLIGPMGPLPTHMSEFAFYEQRYAKTQPFGDWLDVLAGRMLQLFYRAWANSQPAAVADRPEADHFNDYLAAVSGAKEGVSERAAFTARARVHYAGLFASRRSAVGIEDALSHLLVQPVKLLEFQPRWRHLEPDDLTRLGRGYATLGSDAVLGGRIRSASDAYRIVIRAKNYRDYQSLLPTSERFAIAAEALDAFTPSHIEWDVCLEIEDGQAPPARLDGKAQLGWTGWMKPRKPIGDGKVIRADAHLRRLRKSRQRNH
jgi:type VI secretion system protein ImpH